MAGFSAENTLHGSARFAMPQEYRHLLKRSPTSIYLGEVDGKPIWSAGESGIVTFGASRSGKLTTIIAYNFMLDDRDTHFITFDQKGEYNKTFKTTKRPQYTWAPYRKDQRTTVKFNPLDHFDPSDPEWVSHISVFVANFIPVSQTAQKYFPSRAQEILAALIKGIVEAEGSVTFARLMEIIDHIDIDDDVWGSLAFEISKNADSTVLRVVSEINRHRFEDSAAGGWKGVWGEITAAFRFMIDPKMKELFAPPFDFSFKDLCQSERPCDVFLEIPIASMENWAPVLKATVTNIVVHKTHFETSRQQVLLIDEAVTLGVFPLLEKLFSQFPSKKIRTWAVYHGVSQIAENSPTRSIDNLLSSAGTQQFLKLNDEKSLQYLSRKLGTGTYEYADQARQGVSTLQAFSHMHTVTQGEKENHEVLPQIINSIEQSNALQSLARRLRSPDEIEATPENKQYLKEETVPYHLYADRLPYFRSKRCAGKYHPHPEHPPEDKVRVRTSFGYRWRAVISAPVTRDMLFLPQFKNLTHYTYIKGYRP